VQIGEIERDRVAKLETQITEIGGSNRGSRRQKLPKSAGQIGESRRVQIAQFGGLTRGSSATQIRQIGGLSRPGRLGKSDLQIAEIGGAKWREVAPGLHIQEEVAPKSIIGRVSRNGTPYSCNGFERTILQTFKT
jgi:hypothetical protein